MDAEKRLADIEIRVKKAEEWSEAAARKSKELELARDAHAKMAELLKGLEEELRAKNGLILQLEKDADFGRRFRELLVEYGHPPASSGVPGVADHMESITWDYIAGLFDGEGSVLLQSRTFKDASGQGELHYVIPRITISNNDRELLEAVRIFTGYGYVRELRPAQGNHSAQFDYSIYRKEQTVDFARNTLDRCRHKKDQLKELLSRFGQPTPREVSVEDPVAIVAVQESILPVKVDTSSIMGQIAKAVHEGVFTSGTNPSRMKSLLREHFGKDWDKNEIQKVLDELTAPPYRLVTHSVGKDGTHWYSLRKTAKERVVKE